MGKRTYILLVILLVVLSITVLGVDRYNQEIEAGSYISEIELTDREKLFVEAACDLYFAFNVTSTHEESAWMDIWVERYGKGEKISGLGRLSFELRNGEGIIFVSLSENDTSHHWQTSFLQDACKYSREFDSDINFANNGLAKTWGPRSMENMPVTKEDIVLGSICYENQSGAMSSLTDEFYKNPEQNLEEIENYDLVYLIKCRLR